MMKKFFLFLLVFQWLSVQAQVELPAIFTDNMVLQQQSVVKLHGKARANKAVTVHVGWSDETFRTEADEEGKWSMEIPTGKAGGPYEITLSDGKKRELKNIFLGEVWFCSGQSNMEMPVEGWGKVLNYQSEVAAAHYPSIRLFQVKKSTSLVPREEVVSTMDGWQECSPGSVPGFSAIGYFFAREIWNTLKVPVGVIDCTWGGTVAEAWTSIETLKDVTGFGKEVEMRRKLQFNADSVEAHYRKELADWKSGIERNDEGWEVYSESGYADGQWGETDLPGYFDLSLLKGFDGVVWFRRQIEIPAEWAGKELELHMAKIDDEDVTYFNGVKIGGINGYALDRVYKVPARLVRKGKNTLTVRVCDFSGGGGIYGEADQMFLADKKGKRIPLAGKWKYRPTFSFASYPAMPQSPSSNPNSPMVLYNAMVNPLVSFPVKGVLWYQGESNTGRAGQYVDLFQGLISDWRTKWENPSMPFYFVQLASFMKRREVQPDSQWALLREAQTEALHLANTGMAVTIDIGDADDIHPKNKQEVARRLSLHALSRLYGQEEMVASAPMYRDYSVENGVIRLRFDDNDRGFRQEDRIKGFTIAGLDRRFYPAEAVIEGREIVVRSNLVPNPVAVRYGWADNPECSLYGESGLPVSPFRTDNW